MALTKDDLGSFFKYLVKTELFIYFLLTLFVFYNAYNALPAEDLKLFKSFGISQYINSYIHIVFTIFILYALDYIIVGLFLTGDKRIHFKAIASSIIQTILLLSLGFLSYKVLDQNVGIMYLLEHFPEFINYMLNAGISHYNLKLSIFAFFFFLITFYLEYTKTSSRFPSYGIAGILIQLL